MFQFLIIKSFSQQGATSNKYFSRVMQEMTASNQRTGPEKEFVDQAVVQILLVVEYILYHFKVKINHQ